MNSDSLVSVIIIFLNAERFIQEAIQSVFAQTHNCWELLLVDDGSTDASADIARHFAIQRPDQVYYLEHPDHQNRGMSASRNLGIRYARGELIAFLDADDVWLPAKLEQQVSTLQSKPEAGMLYGNTLYWHSWTGNPEDIHRDYVPNLGLSPNTCVDPPKLLPLFLGGKAAVPCPSSILVRRDILERLGGFEESFQGLYEDQVIYAKICLHAPVFVSGECWDRYRQHPDSTCSMASKEDRLDNGRSKYLKWLEEYLIEQKITDNEVWRALRKEKWRVRHPNFARLERVVHRVERHMQG